MTEQLSAWLMPSLPGQKALALLHLPPAGDGAWLAGSPAASPPGWVPGEGTVSVFTVDYGRAFEVNPPIILPHLLRSSLRCRVAREHTGWMFSQVEVSWECMAGAHLVHPRANQPSVPDARLRLLTIKTS